jgi:hypothetical protein
MVRKLEAMSAGEGAADAIAFAEWVWSEAPMLVVGQSHGEALVEALRVLGLVDSSGPLGLTDQARLLLAGGQIDGVAAGDGETSSGASVFVQGDRTVTVLVEAPLEARLLLDRIAVLESDGGARLYRLTEASLRTAMDGGLGAEEIVTGLEGFTQRDLPQPVVHLVRDVERTRGRLMLASAVTVVASQDPVAIAEAVRVKAAKLKSVGPYTAVSLLPAEKVRAALAAKDVHVLVEAEPAGETAGSERSIGRRSQPREGEGPAPLGYIGHAEFATVAAALKTR